MFGIIAVRLSIRQLGERQPSFHCAAFLPLSFPANRFTFSVRRDLSDRPFPHERIPDGYDRPWPAKVGENDTSLRGNLGRAPRRTIGWRGTAHKGFVVVSDAELRSPSSMPFVGYVLRRIGWKKVAEYGFPIMNFRASSPTLAHVWQSSVRNSSFGSMVSVLFSNRNSTDAQGIAANEPQASWWWNGQSAAGTVWQVQILGRLMVGFCRSDDSWRAVFECRLCFCDGFRDPPAIANREDVIHLR